PGGANAARRRCDAAPRRSSDRSRRSHSQSAAATRQERVRTHAGRVLQPPAPHGAHRMTRGVVILPAYFFPVIGGVERNAERLARFLASQGVTVHVLTKRIRRGLPDQEQRDGLTIHRTGPYGERS